MTPPQVEGARLARAPGGERPTFGFLLEQTLGHVTHGANLTKILSAEPSITARWRPIRWEPHPLLGKLPGAANWTVRAGLRARRAIAQLEASGPLDALFIHTQVPAVLAGTWLRRIPTVVSIDATPLQYDDLGSFYDHHPGNERIERLKWLLNQRCFEQAAHLVAWSHWAKSGLIEGYGIAPDSITVIPPGVDVAAWSPPAERVRTSDGPVKILFVGGDLARKGGTLLLEAFRLLQQRRSPLEPDAELHLVTQAAVPASPGVVVHAGMTPNSPGLRALYHTSDIFCLPTRGDCLPMVLSEAGAAGLPLVSTGVGAIPEIVRDGETGAIVPRDDAAFLATVLQRLVTDPNLRRQQGAAAAALVRRDFDARRNAQRLLAVLREAAAAGPAQLRPSRQVWGRSHETRSGDGPRSNDVLLTVSGVIPHDLTQEIAQDRRPRPDYLVMAGALGADLLDHAEARCRTGLSGRVVQRLLGSDVLLAWACFRERNRYRVVFTDGEQVGLPYALLTLFSRSRPRHLMIVHILSVPKKALLFRALPLARRIDVLFPYATAQQRYIREQLGVPSDRVVRTSFMVDTTFFRPAEAPPRRMICSAGLEWRDYPTMIEAVRGLDVDVVLAAASPWARHHRATAGDEVPDNVEVCRLNFADLRRLYAESAFVVMPLREVAFQAGVTTILEAMAMGKAVICSRTAGQTDVVVHEETGLYVRPGDPAELRAAIERLLADPELARRMGAAGRRRVVEEMAVERYANRFAQWVRSQP